MNDDIEKWNSDENEEDKNKELVKIYLEYERKENDFSYNKEDKEVL